MAALKTPVKKVSLPIISNMAKAQDEYIGQLGKVWNPKQYWDQRIAKAANLQLIKNKDGELIVTSMAPTTTVPTKAAKGSKSTGKAKPAKAAKKNGKAKANGEGGLRGRKSIYSGKRLYPAAAIKGANPRRDGTAGHAAMAIILKGGKAGVTYEDYMAKGGASNHLAYDIDKGNVVVK